MDLSRDRLILELQIGCKSVDWIRDGEDMEQWRALLKTVMNLWVP
jgi:hypothetical protein